jgi:HEAT repeat protein
MAPDELVQRFASKVERTEAIRALVGGVTATELRSVTLTDAAYDALLDGLTDPKPQIRWWCVQLLDHLPDDRAVGALAGMLDDPVPRVRRNAAHALGCVACKPAWTGALPAGTADKLVDLAAHDPSAKVRREARLTLACTTR